MPNQNKHLGVYPIFIHFQDTHLNLQPKLREVKALEEGFFSTLPRHCLDPAEGNGLNCHVDLQRVVTGKCLVYPTGQLVAVAKMTSYIYIY